ncbi:mechanosensitive ion channel family protein [Alteromonas macleodii]|uniref:Mechanosensitive ion channel family protein n=1 Tax=Alteromonas macleodii TaxID=28108 RepID=A0AB36FNB2_ALTMA|nr:mechanosensitive ion channel family protein [Alteromonas macleodii]OES25079.1 mechanosensitive ion channel family protein [Alteromonas macleodii]OES39122.1 mechanosensitive ion channel family protein [Alteromonas macleodii]
MLHGIDLALIGTLPEYQHIAIKVGLTLAVLYVAIFCFQVVSYFSRKKFGEEKQVDGVTSFMDTYNSRLVDVVGVVMIILCLLYSLIAIWELTSLLQTTGFIGVIFAFLVVTNGIWAPDIYHGLTILNSNAIGDGDVIMFDGETDEFIVNKITFNYTVLLDIRNNNRVLIRNSQLINSKIRNLSKRASPDGLRYAIDFNIGYPSIVAGDDLSTRKAEFLAFRKRVEEMFADVEQTLKTENHSTINFNCPFELVTKAAGDYAITFTLYYHVDAIPNTRTTRKVRSYVLGSKFRVIEAVTAGAHAHGIDLSTPALIQLGSSACDDLTTRPDSFIQKKGKQ